MKIKNETTTKKVKIEFPFYCKSESEIHYYKVFSKNKCISICDLEDIYSSIQIQSSQIAFEGGFKQITESEFINKFNEVNEILIKLAL